jgi:phage tail sheath protein FI
MPEYLAPGVFVEEVSGGVKPIAGVSTSTIGMVGIAQRGPVDEPTLVTSFGAYMRTFGGLLDQRVFTNARHSLPYAVQAAFDNGAARIYVNRIVGANATFATADLFGNDAAAPASTTLADRATSGATVLRIADGTNLANGDSLLLLDGQRSEVVVASSDPVAVGIALGGRLHADKAVGDTVVLQAAPIDGATLAVSGPMTAGGALVLDAASIAGLTAGAVLRIRQADDATRTEFVTIAADGAAAFSEGTLSFDHPQATVEVHVVTFADTATTTTIGAIAAAGAALVALAATAGFAEGDVVAIGAGSAREYHVIRSIASDLSIATTPTTAIHGAGVMVMKQVPSLRVYARDQGQWGNQLRVRTRPSPLSTTVVVGAVAEGGSPATVRSSVGLQIGSVVNIQRAGTEIARQRVTALDRATNQVELAGGAAVALADGDAVVSSEFSLIIELLDANGKIAEDEAFDNLALDPVHPRYAPHIIGAFDRGEGEPEKAGLSDLIRLADLSFADDGTPVDDADEVRLTTPFDGIARTLAGGGDDLDTITEATYVGVDADDVDDRTGIQALTGIDDISIVAVPGQTSQVVQNAMITHCELMRYRIAVLDGAPNARLADIQTQRQLYDSTRGALYHPWLIIPDPFGRPSDRLAVPPSGAVCGAYALTDNERGVHKAPANVVVRNILGLQATLTKGEQEILNPRGINVIRDFSSLGRAIRIWGARTVSSDPEWIYVPVRRLFLFVEKSIERGTQFAVFEPNSTALWATISRSITNFLTGVWRDGALAGSKPEEAFFVQVGNDTMTQADIDAGRLIVLIGIAPVKPAEFVIFRISQKTAGASA